MDETVRGNTVGLVSGNAFACLGAPIGADVMEARSGMAYKRSEHHCDTVAGVVLGCERRRSLSSVPVESGCHDRFGEIGVRKPVGPLSLSLEAADYGVSSESFFMPAHIIEFFISVKNIPDYQGHLNDKFPIFVGGNNF